MGNSSNLPAGGPPMDGPGVFRENAPYDRARARSEDRDFHFKFHAHMGHKFIIAADRAHLRIYRYSQQPGQFTPSIQPVDAYDIPEGEHSYADSQSDLSGRFSAGKSRSSGLSLDEHVPVADEREREIVEQLAERITVFLEKHPNSTWDFAAGSGLRSHVIDALPDSVRLRLDQVISKDLVNVPPVELRQHFALR